MSPPALLWPDDPSAVSLLLVGDTNIQDRAQPASAFVHVQAVLHHADVLFGQLEGQFAGT